MPVISNLHLGRGIVRGDQFSIRRTLLNIPPGLLISSAQLTLKSDLSVADNAAEIFKDITTTDSAGTGQVESAGSGGVGAIRFDLTEADTLNLVASRKYFFDIQVKLDSGDILTPESGETSATEQVTTS